MTNKKDSKGERPRKGGERRGRETRNRKIDYQDFDQRMLEKGEYFDREREEERKTEKI